MKLFELPLCLAFAVVVAVEDASAQDLSVCVTDVAYDSRDGKLGVVVGLRNPAGLAPVRVMAASEAYALSAECSIEKPSGDKIECKLDWPRAPLASKIRITVSAQGAVKEADLSNNVVEVTMEQALNGYLARLPKPLPMLKPAELEGKPSMVFEAEDFPVQRHVQVEEVKAASGGKAVRLLNRHSRIERMVELEEGVYSFYAVAMAFAGNQDALNVSLAGHKQRGHLSGYRKWIRQDWCGTVAVKKGSYKQVAYYDEPQVLVDKVVVVKRK